MGFTHFCGQLTTAAFIVWRITAKKRMVAKLKSLKAELSTPEASSYDRGRCMAPESCAGLLPIPRCSGQLDSVAHFPPTRLPAVAECPHPSQSTRPGALGSSLSSLDAVDSSTPHSASLSRCPLRRYPSPVRAVCVNALVRICAGGDQRWSSLPRHLAHSFHGWLLPCRQGFTNSCR